MRLMTSDKIYTFDIESVPNFFSCVIKHRLTGRRWIFEVSDWQNDAVEFINFLFALSYHGCFLIGFNNFYYDWQVCEYLMNIGGTFTALDAYTITKRIIEGCGSCGKCRSGNSFRCETNFKQTVWAHNQRVKQIDLYLIHHFNNFAKSTSLKETEFNMQSRNVGDLPFVAGQPIDATRRESTLIYNCHDVDETEQFAIYSEPMVDFRFDLVESMGVGVMSFDDTKIGKKYFEKEIKTKAPHLLGTYDNKKQTTRTQINLGDVILPQIEFETPEFQRVLSFLRGTTITKTKAPPELEDLSATLNGFRFDVGAGGGHGSVERQCVRPEPGWKLVDVDVASYYPNLAIQNRFFPAHLSEAFCDIYLDVYQQRQQHKKKTAPNEMLKLALNGVYGDSANEHSIFLDPQYTMQITINGQLLLYLLAEKIHLHTRGKMIQLNTDGITFLIPEADEQVMRQICKWWEEFTKLELEFADYEAMWIRDVNSYMAKTVGTDDAPSYVKRIGAYAHVTQRENPSTREVKWNKDHSALIVPKAAEAEMVHGVPVRDFIYNHKNAFDFMLRSKATGKTKQRLFRDGDVDSEPTYELNEDGTHKHHLDKNGKPVFHMIVEPDGGEWLQKVTRYYIAHEGGTLQMIYAPAPAQKERRRKKIIRQHVGWKVATCDLIDDYVPENLNREWYVSEAEKLVIR